MRFAVTAELGTPDVRIDYPDNSAPRLASTSPCLSLSHCGETAAVVVADRRVIGCDILSLAREVHWQRIAASFFNEADHEWIMAAPAEARQRFGSLWCINEAIAKCSGEPLLKVLRESAAVGAKSRYWTQSGTVADCSFAVASDAPLAVDVLEVPIEAL
jgi:phosphopantetheinyl transferase